MRATTVRRLLAVGALISSAVSSEAANVSTDVPAAMAAMSETSQTQPPNTRLAYPFAVRLTDALKAPFPGTMVRFTSPSFCGQFVNGSSSVEVFTDASGIATAPSFTIASPPSQFVPGSTYCYAAATAPAYPGLGSQVFEFYSYDPSKLSLEVSPASISVVGGEPISFTVRVLGPLSLWAMP